MLKSNTCLAVLRDKNGYLWFAGDRRISWNYSKAIKGPRSKVTKRNNILFAGTGTSCICDLVTDQFEVPIKTDMIDSYTYIHKVLVPALIKQLKEEGWINDGERKLAYDNILDSRLDDCAPHAILIIGVGSDLYELDLNTQLITVDAIDAPYAAGCGGELAWGSLLTTEKLRMTPKARLKLAVEIAAKVSPGCDDNVDIISNR